MHIAIVTDAWHPQVNGVVRSLSELASGLRTVGDEVTFVSPDQFTTVPCPTYPTIRLAVGGRAKLRTMLDDPGIDHIHIATEGPLGLWARSHALAKGYAFTTSYHTKFPEYLAARAPVPSAMSYACLRRFHNAGNGCMVASATLRAELSTRGFSRLMDWPRGVDAQAFRPVAGADLGFPRPIFLSVGRVAIEKNLDAFLSLDLPGTKVAVGDGPDLESLRQRHPEAKFLGALYGEDLVRAYSAADVFVFPSLTDTFGNVMLEALACGVPVAAFPVTGPLDAVCDSRVGMLDADLKRAALDALKLDRQDARDYALQFTWQKSVASFRTNVLAASGKAKAPPRDVHERLGITPRAA